MLLLLLIATPLLGVIIKYLFYKKSINVNFIVCTTVLILGTFGLKGVFDGDTLAIKINLPGPFTPILQADPLSVIFVILASFLWFVVSIYSPQYMVHEGGSKNFALITMLTFSAVLGVFLAGSLVTMLLFFELMTIASYFWVIHRWNKEAIKAGYFYLFFSIVGGLFIALGIVLMGAATESLPIIGSGPVSATNPAFFGWSIALLMVGFGIKGGMAPLHLWLPHAHSVAPTPGSALLSGLIIKIGAYGLIRVGEFAGWGTKLTGSIGWLGTALTLLGTCTMLVGVLAALLQSDAKRLLAYHSVSQMGYIILGLGIALYLGPEGSLGLLGAIYHIVNHALFKAALFLGVGIIYIHTKETDLYKLGGLWRRFPVTAFLMLLAVLGITGAPGLNGYASKTLLHHAVSLAATKGIPWLVWVERLFLIVGVGTAASFSKLYYLIFLSKPTDIRIEKYKFSLMQWAIGILAVIMVIIGFWPTLFPKFFAAPAAENLGMTDAASQLIDLSFWNFNDIKGMLITLALGILVCWGGLRSGIFHWQPPFWLTLEGWGKLIYQALAFLRQRTIDLLEKGKSALPRFYKNIKISLRSVIFKLTQPAGDKSGDNVLTGISADAAVLIIVLALLIAWYAVISPLGPSIGKLFSLVTNSSNIIN